MAPRFTIVTGGAANVNAVAPASAAPTIALSAAAAKSLWLLNPINNTTLIEFGVGFDGSTATTPIQVMLYRTTTLGTPAGSAPTINKIDPNSQASGMTSALTNLTTEATAIDVLQAWPVAANNGLFVIQYPLGREPFGVAAGARIGLLAKTPASVSPNATSYVMWEE